MYSKDICIFSRVFVSGILAIAMSDPPCVGIRHSYPCLQIIAIWKTVKTPHRPVWTLDLVYMQEPEINHKAISLLVI